MSKNRKLKWPLIIVCGVAVVPAFVLGLWAYTALTAETYHPNAKVWIPFAVIGVIAAFGLWVFGRRAKRWSDMNA